MSPAWCSVSRRAAALLVAGLSIALLTATMTLTVLAIRWSERAELATGAARPAAPARAAATESVVEYDIRLLDTLLNATTAVTEEAGADSPYGDVTPGPTSDVTSAPPTGPRGGGRRADAAGAEPRGDLHPAGDGASLSGSASTGGHLVTAETPPPARPAPADQQHEQAGEPDGRGGAAGGRPPALSRHLWLRMAPGPLTATLTLQAVYLAVTAALVGGVLAGRAHLVLLWLVAAGLGLAVGSAGALLSAQSAMMAGTATGRLAAAAHVAAIGLLWYGWTVVLAFYRHTSAPEPAQHQLKPHFSDC